MQRYENDCCDCAVPGYPCLGESCEKRHVLHLYCDGCGEEAEELYEYYEAELCEDCLLKEVPKVNIND